MSTDYDRRVSHALMLASDKPPTCRCDRGEGHVHGPTGSWCGPVGGHRWTCPYREWVMQGFC